jgi:geranylgeranyl pyrophosphate synthase
MGGSLDLADVLSAMRADLNIVEERLREEANVDYPFIGEILRGIIGGGGKRLRPLILLLAAKPFTYGIDRLVPAAVGVELLHTASLIHDDTVDHALLRRGRPTLNSLFSTETVILIGDYVFARSAMMAAATMNPRVVKVFATSLADICDGQLREIFTAHQLTESLDDYRRRIFGKTAALFAGAAEMGAILGGADDAQIEALNAYGGHVGMAFQIVDDVLDLRQSTDEIGKPAGLDLRQGTVTLPTMLFFQNHADNGHSDLVRRVIGGDGATDDDYLAATVAIRQSGAIDHALDIAANYVHAAKDALRVIPRGEAQDMLACVAELSLQRTS